MLLLLLSLYIFNGLNIFYSSSCKIMHVEDSNKTTLLFLFKMFKLRENKFTNIQQSINVLKSI